MSHNFINAIKRHASQMDMQYSHGQWATVQTYNPNNNTAKVILQPQQSNTGWLPVLTPFTSGNGGMVAGLVPNQQVFVVFDHGDRDSGVIVGSAYSSQFNPPTGAAGGQVVSSDLNLSAGGTSIHIQGSGQITITAGATIISVAPNGAISMSAPTVSINGNLAVNGSLNVTGDITGNGHSLSRHTHTSEGVGSQTSPPNG